MDKYFDEHDVWYRNVMRDTVLLTKEEEEELGKKILAGQAEGASDEAIEIGKRAQEELVKNNLSLVYLIASDPKYRVVEKNDLIQEGNMGLMRAAEKFDCNKNVKFSTYAFAWIKKYICKAVSDAYNYNNEVEHYVENEEDEEDAYDNMFGADGHDYYEDVLEDITRGYVNEKIHAGVDSLGGMYGEIIRDRYGFNGPNAMTVDEISRKYGISRMGVRAIEECAINRLRKECMELEDCIPE